MFYTAPESPEPAVAITASCALNCNMYPLTKWGLAHLNAYEDDFATRTSDLKLFHLQLYTVFFAIITLDSGVLLHNLPLPIHGEPPFPRPPNNAPIIAPGPLPGYLGPAERLFECMAVISSHGEGKDGRRIGQSTVQPSLFLSEFSLPLSNRSQ